MRIDKITVNGFTTYKKEATLDLAALGPGIIAVTGPNGSGKTTLLEAVPGAVYRQSPSRGSIATIATVRDARIEISGENGNPFTIRLDVDVHTGKQEAVIFDAAGMPLAGPKVRDFDKYIADHFPTLDVYLASFFASQTGVGSVLRMARADRRALFGRLLGLERLEEMAASARERARQSETDLSSVQAALAAMKEGAGDAGVLEASLAEVRESGAKAAEALAAARETARLASAEYDHLTALQNDAQRAEKRLQEARLRASRLLQDSGAVAASLTALNAFLGEAPAIRKHAASLAALALEIEEIRKRGESLAVGEREALAKVSDWQRKLNQAEKVAREADRALADAEGKVQDWVSRMEAAEKSTASVPCAGALSDKLRAGCTALSGHFRVRDDARKNIDFLNARIPGLLQDFNASVDSREEIAAELKFCIEQSLKARAAGEEARNEYRKANAELADLRARDRSSQLDRAEAEAGALRERLEAVKKEADEAKAAAETAAAECPKIDDSEILKAAYAAKRTEAEVQDAVRLDAEVQRAVAKYETQVEAARAAEARAARISVRVPALEHDLADWRFLARALGREGVQALELDAAGPRVSALANELLADAYGPRFQIRFETQAAKADGKGVKETFDIVVVDAEKGREGSGEDLSGGEKVIVGEALGLAVGLFHAQAAGVSLGTVIRDETVGALDPENGERYIAMLRAFLRIGGVHQLLYVAHQPALVDMADAVVRIEDGLIKLNG